MNSTVIKGYADDDTPTVTLHSSEDMLVAIWEGGPQYGIVARRINDGWAVATTTGWFEFVPTRSEAQDMLLMSARTWF